MVGGRITEIIYSYKRESMWVNVVDSRDSCSLYMEYCDKVAVGDRIWWQQKYVYWTSRTNPGESDVALRKLSVAGTCYPQLSIGGTYCHRLE